MTNNQLPSVEKDLSFISYRYPNSPRTKAMMVDIQEHCLKIEPKVAPEPRLRRRKAKDLLSWKRQVEALISEAAYQHMMFPHRWISVPFSKRVLGSQGRYGSPVLSKQLPKTVKLLAHPEVQLLEYELGYDLPGTTLSSMQTRFRAGKELIRAIEEMDLDISEFVRRDDGEVIILRKGKEHRLDKAVNIPYKDTDLTNRYRQELTAINTWLAQADIELDWDEKTQNVDTGRRYLRRVFNNGSFSEGGRLFYGYWMDLSKEQRRELLLINGNPVVVLDFGQMAARILYGMVGLEPTFTDAYSLPSLSGKHRATVKKIFNAMLNVDKPLTRFPPNTKPKEERMRFAEITQSILSFHAPVAHLLYSGIGLKVMFRESEITVAILTRLMKMGIVALPIHDAVIVEECNQESVREVMLSTFKEFTGVSGRVDVEGDASSGKMYLPSPSLGISA